MTLSLSIGQARRLALGAQGLTGDRPSGRIDRRHIRSLFGRIGVLQVDSVNVLARSEELPVLARLGPHRRDLVRSMEAGGELFEYWIHEASLAPVTLEPLLRWKMANAHQHAWTRELAQRRNGFVEEVYAEVLERGPVRVADLTGSVPTREAWWGWNDHKRAIEYLFWEGRLSARRSPRNFERIYDVRERVIPADVIATPTPDEHEARKQLLVHAAGHHGVGTARCLADYHRQHVPSARPLLGELVEEGRLVPVEVRGWSEAAYALPTVAIPRRARARALLSPFDSLIWERTRTERLWDFRYRIEIYTPATKRVHGYYVLPFLLGDALVARVDLKADRAASTLRVQSAHGEAGIDEHTVAAELREELRVVADHLELEHVAVAEQGDLAGALRRS